MPAAIKGVVREGRVVPESPLPEGAEVQIVLSPLDVPEELAAEFEAWGLASDRALDLVERQAADLSIDAPR